ncbi:MULTISPECIES: ABC transporter substrate-binding protein [unclassified Archaeoglobus]|jgi:branched-chain amino acid transport system substrate-binding protein|uniref:ABC transporter substrate-binding protein n=1 Tax=unclassified Archaeoglobus TaxID=2643606 RepID=UPI0025B8F9C5|nr:MULTISPECIES: ABC transporter substrate-binding protein [unclassified Archaeoglobus]
MRPTRREFLKLVGAGAAWMMLGGCAQPPAQVTPTPTTPPTTPKVTKELKLGYVAFRAGPAAAFGEPAHRAIDMMVERINAAGGVAGAKIKVIHEEEGSTSDTVEKFKKLCLEDKVDVIMGLNSTANSMAAAPVAEENSTLFIACQARIPYVTWKDPEDPSKGVMDWVFKANNSAVAHAVQAAWLLKEFAPDAKVVGQIHPDYAWGYDNYNYFSAAIKKLMPDVELLDPLYPKLFTPDYTPYITELVNSKPDYIFTSLWGSDTTRFIDQLIPYGLLKGTGGNTLLCAYWDFYVVTGREIPVFGHVQQSSQKGIAYPVKPEDFDPDWEWLIKEFKSRFGQFPQSGAFDAGDALNFWVAGINKAYEEKGEFPTNDDIRDALENLGSYKSFGEVGIVRKEDHRVLWGAAPGVVSKAPSDDPLQRPYVHDPALLVTAEQTEPPALTDPIEWINSW